MFFSAPPNPSKTKHVTYIAAAIVLGICVSAFVQYIIEYVLLILTDVSWLNIHGYNWSIHGIFYGSLLHPVSQVLILLLGVYGGYRVGKYWWRLVYVERKWAKGKSGV